MVTCVVISEVMYTVLYIITEVGRHAVDDADVDDVDVGVVTDEIVLGVELDLDDSVHSVVEDVN